MKYYASQECDITRTQSSNFTLEVSSLSKARADLSRSGISGDLTVFCGAKRNPEKVGQASQKSLPCRENTVHTTRESMAFIFSLDHGGKSIAAADIDDKVKKWMLPL